jgi:hypothetical protein
MKKELTIVPTTFRTTIQDNLPQCTEFKHFA